MCSIRRMVLWHLNVRLHRVKQEHSAQEVSAHMGCQMYTLLAISVALIFKYRPTVINAYSISTVGILRHQYSQKEKTSKKTVLPLSIKDAGDNPCKTSSDTLKSKTSCDKTLVDLFRTRHVDW